MAEELIRDFGATPETYRGGGFQPIAFPVGRTPADYGDYTLLLDVNFAGVTETIPPMTFTQTRGTLLAEGDTGLSAPQFTMGIRVNRFIVRLKDGNYEWAITDEQSVPLPDADDSFRVLRLRGNYAPAASPETPVAALEIAKRQLAAVNAEVDNRLFGGSTAVVQETFGNGDFQISFLPTEKLLDLQDRLSERVAILEGGGVFVAPLSRVDRDIENNA